MTEGQLETGLAELARLREDDSARREVLDRASVSMLHRPALGGQLIARICATEETAPEGAAITADWIDGFLMAITLAPKMIAPNRWLPEILGSAVAGLTSDSLQRFADL